MALISCQKCRALIKRWEKCWGDDLFSFVTYKMETLQTSGEVWERLEGSRAQERGTAVPWTKAAGRGEQWDTPPRAPQPSLEGKAAMQGAHRAQFGQSHGWGEE